MFENSWYEHEAQERREARLHQKLRAPATFPECAPSLWPLMRFYLETRGLDYALAGRNGWYPSGSAGDSEPRVVMPATRTDGGIFWQARALKPATDKRYQSPHATRGDALILVEPEDTGGKLARTAAIVEGPMDALSAASVGLLGIALMGNTPNEVVLEHVRQVIKDRSMVYVIPDSNALGNGAYLTGWLRSNTRAMVTMWYPYPFKDLASVPYERRKEIFAD